LLEIRGILEPGDYIRAQYLHLRPRLTYKIIGVLVIAAFVWAAWLSLTIGDVDIMDFLFVSLPFLLILHFAVYLPWKTRRIFKQQKALQRKLVFTFDAEGVTTEAENGNWKTPWEDYVRWKKNDRLILLYVSDCMYHMLPKRLLAEPGDFDSLSELVKEKVEKYTP
jgi:hypothetical protein